MPFEEVGVRAVVAGAEQYVANAQQVNAATSGMVAGAVRAQTSTAQMAGALTTAGAEVTRATARMGTSLTAVGAQIREVSAQALLLGAGLAAPGTAAVAFAISFESAFAGVRKTVDATEAEFAQLRTTLLDMSQELPVSADALSGVAEAAGQLGIAFQNIPGFVRTVTQLVETTNLTLDGAATGLAQFANILQLPQDQLGRVGAALVDLGNKGASTEVQILEFALRIAGAGKVVGLSADQILAFGNGLASVGIEAEAGGTAISRTFIELAKAVDLGGEQLERFATVAGQSASDFAQAFRADAAAATVTFIEGLGRITEAGEGTFSVLEELSFNDARLTRSLLAAAGAGDLLRQSLVNGANAYAENTALTTEYSRRLDTASVQARLLINDIRRLAIDTGTLLLPAFRQGVDLARALVDAFSAIPAPVRAVAAGLLVLGGAATVAVASTGLLVGSLLTIAGGLGAGGAGGAAGGGGLVAVGAQAGLAATALRTFAIGGVATAVAGLRTLGLALSTALASMTAFSVNTSAAAASAFPAFATQAGAAGRAIGALGAAAAAFAASNPILAALTAITVGVGAVVIAFDRLANRGFERDFEPVILKLRELQDELRRTRDEVNETAAALAGGLPSGEEQLPGLTGAQSDRARFLQQQLELLNGRGAEITDPNLSQQQQLARGDVAAALGIERRGEALRALRDAEAELNRVRGDSRSTSTEIANAELAVSLAQQTVERSTTRVTEAGLNFINSLSAEDRKLIAVAGSTRALAEEQRALNVLNARRDNAPSPETRARAGTLETETAEAPRGGSGADQSRQRAIEASAVAFQRLAEARARLTAVESNALSTANDLAAAQLGVANASQQAYQAGLQVIASTEAERTAQQRVAESSRQYADAIANVNSAQANLDAVRRSSTATTEDVERAERDLEQAQRDLQRISQELPGDLYAVAGGLRAVAADSDAAAAGQRALADAMADVAREADAQRSAFEAVFDPDEQGNLDAAGFGAPEDFPGGDTGLDVINRLRDEAAAARRGGSGSSGGGSAAKEPDERPFGGEPILLQRARAAQQVRERQLQEQAEAVIRHALGLGGKTREEVQIQQAANDAAFDGLLLQFKQLGILVPESLRDMFDRMRDAAEEEAEKGDEIGGLLGFLIARRIGRGLDPTGGLVALPPGYATGGAQQQGNGTTVNFGDINIAPGAPQTVGDIMQGVQVGVLSAFSSR